MDIVGCGGASFISRLRRGGGRGAGFRARDRDLFRSFRAACIPVLLPLPSEEEISSQNTEASSSASTQAPPESHEPPASSSPASSAPPQGKINLNTAGKEELMSIKGLGEILAERILDYRERHGGFDSLEELMEVDGIGEKRFATWKPYLTL